MKHPAKFSDSVLTELYQHIEMECRKREWECPLLLLDPFAGVGKIHELSETWTELETVGVEIEPEWASEHPKTIVGDSRSLPFQDEWFDIIATSPTYANRMADHHDAKDGSRRMTYRHSLGRPLSDGNSGSMQWGKDYKHLHIQVWQECLRVLKPGRLFLLNLSNHIRKGEVVDVVGWHRDTLTAMGFTLEQEIDIPTPRMRFGANHKARVESEKLLVLRSPERKPSRVVNRKRRRV